MSITPVTVYQTSDGARFADKILAQRHQDSIYAMEALKMAFIEEIDTSDKTGPTFGFLNLFAGEHYIPLGRMAEFVHAHRELILRALSQANNRKAASKKAPG